jgi:hypothetical protein
MLSNTITISSTTSSIPKRKIMLERDRICELREENINIRMVSGTIKGFMVSWTQSLFGMQARQVSKKMPFEKRPFVITLCHFKMLLCYGSKICMVYDTVIEL